MAILDILTSPNPLLKEVCDPITDFGVELARLIDDMFETMEDNRGVGLAAPQVGVLSQVFVASHKDESLVCINPVLNLSGGYIDSEEGCLSIPDLTLAVERRENVELMAFDVLGNPFKRSLSGFLAIVVQHEYDHLVGRLITDHGRVVETK